MTGTRAGALLAAGALVLASAAGSAGAAAWKAGGDQLYGPASYVATSGFFEVGSAKGAYLRPSFASYHSDEIKATTAYAARAGYTDKRWDAGAELSVTPKVAGYRNESVGADATYSFYPRGGLSRVDLGGGIRRIAHKEDSTAPALVAARTRAGRGRPGGPPGPGGEPAAIDAGETDISIISGAAWGDLDLDAQLTRSFYSDTLPELARAAELSGTVGANPAVFGFPETSVSIKGSWTAWPRLKPSFRYSRTTYKQDGPATSAYAFSLATKWAKVQVKGTCELFDPGGGAGLQSYYGLGVTLRI
ncbi:MAG: hypothetical protein HY926_12780 [Elusimicrobia bacterium]|nr:hypothetical protein [Elusimicrobiota bacterium]